MRSGQRCAVLSAAQSGGPLEVESSEEVRALLREAFDRVAAKARRRQPSHASRALSATRQTAVALALACSHPELSCVLRSLSAAQRKAGGARGGKAGPPRAGASSSLGSDGPESASIRGASSFSTGAAAAGGKGGAGGRVMSVEEAELRAVAAETRARAASERAEEEKRRQARFASTQQHALTTA